MTWALGIQAKFSRSVQVVPTPVRVPPHQWRQSMAVVLTATSPRASLGKSESGLPYESKSAGKPGCKVSHQAPSDITWISALPSRRRLTSCVASCQTASPWTVSPDARQTDWTAFKRFINRGEKGSIDHKGRRLPPLRRNDGSDIFPPPDVGSDLGRRGMPL